MHSDVRLWFIECYCGEKNRTPFQRSLSIHASGVPGRVTRIALALPDEISHRYWDLVSSVAFSLSLKSIGHYFIVQNKLFHTLTKQRITPKKLSARETKYWERGKKKELLFLLYCLYCQWNDLHSSVGSYNQGNCDHGYVTLQILSPAIFLHSGSKRADCQPGVTEEAEVVSVLVKIAHELTMVSPQGREADVHIECVSLLMHFSLLVHLIRWADRGFMLLHYPFVGPEPLFSDHDSWYCLHKQKVLCLELRHVMSAP